MFKDLVDRERSLWFGDEFNRAVKRMKIPEGMFDDGIEASIKRSFVGRQEGEGGSSGGLRKRWRRVEPMGRCRLLLHWGIFAARRWKLE